MVHYPLFTPQGAAILGAVIITAVAGYMLYSYMTQETSQEDQAVTNPHENLTTQQTSQEDKAVTNPHENLETFFKHRDKIRNKNTTTSKPTQSKNITLVNAPLGKIWEAKFFNKYCAERNK